MAVKEKLKLGDVLVHSGVITEEQLEKALQVQKQYRLQLGQVLVEMKLITDEQLVATLSEQLGMPRVDLQRTKIKQDAIQKVKENLARKHKLIPVEIKNGKLVVAMTHPMNLFAVDVEFAGVARLKSQPVPSPNMALSLRWKTFHQSDRKRSVTIKNAD